MSGLGLVYDLDGVIGVPMGVATNAERVDDNVDLSIRDLLDAELEPWLSGQRPVG